MNKPGFLSLSLLSLGLVACADDPPTPAEVRARIAKDLGHVLTEADLAGAGAAEAAPGDGAMTMIDRMLGDSNSEIAVRVRTQVGAFVVKRQLEQAVAKLGAPADEAGANVSAETVAYLNDNLFTDTNHEGEGVFKIPSSLVCTEVSIDENGTESETLDPECARQWDLAEVRIRVSTDDDAMQFTLQMTKEREEPVRVGLEPESVALTIDLDDAWRSAAALATIAGEPLPNADLSGQVTGKLTILGAAHAQIAFAIDRDVSIKLAQDGKDLDGAEAFRFTSKEAPVFEISADGVAKAGAFTLGVAETYAHVPSSLFDEASTEPAETFELDLAGITAHAEFAAGQPTTLTNVGLGDRELITKLNGRVASWTSVNAEDGRTFGATITDDVATGRSTISVTPKLDIRSFTDHAVQGTEPEMFDVTRILLAGSISGDTETSTVKVETGTYSIETNPAQFGFSATAGQCVTSEEALDEASGFYYTRYTTGACQ